MASENVMLVMMSAEGIAQLLTKYASALVAGLLDVIPAKHPAVLKRPDAKNMAALFLLLFRPVPLFSFRHPLSFPGALLPGFRHFYQGFFIFRLRLLCHTSAVGGIFPVSFCVFHHDLLSPMKTRQDGAWFCEKYEAAMQNLWNKWRRTKLHWKFCGGRLPWLSTGI
jgi:hypothetical protein